MAPGNDRLPGGLIPVEQLGRLVENGSVSTVMLAMTDMRGRLKGKRHPARFFLDHLVEHGSEGCAYLLATDAEMRPVYGYELASWDTGYSDLRLVPDPLTLRHLPDRHGSALVLADVRHKDGRPVTVAPREMLHQQLSRLGALGLTAKVGLETEFTVYRGRGHDAERTLQPIFDRNLDYALRHSLSVRQYLVRLEERLTDSGLPLEAVKTESSPGQIEVTFRYGEPLASADDHQVFRHIAQSVTEEADSTLTFMAAPVTGVGNGLHLHVSLWRGEEPALPDGRGGLSPVAEQAIAGLIDVLPQAMPLLLPTVNSYKRLRMESFAPTRMNWGMDNRTCAIRVTGHGSGVHLEVRIPGADANSYVMLAAVLAACRHGIERRLQPPPPVTGDGYHAGTAPLLPHNLDTALNTFRTSELAAQLFGTDVVTHYAMAGQIESDAVSARVTDVERERGFLDA